MRPASYSLSEDIRATLLRVLAYMGGLVTLAVAAASFIRAPAFVAALDTAPQPQWIKVERPYPAFELMAPELAASPFDYAILRRAADGARKDVLTWGSATGAGPYVLVEVYRPGSQSQPFIDAESEIAARILDYAVTDDVKPAGRSDSKFGAVPLVDFAIAAHGRERRCLGFARAFDEAFDEPSMQIAGWDCSPGDEVVARPALSCLLDRLTIVSAGGDSKLDAFFANAEIRRTFCGQRNPILAATPEREAPVVEPHRTRLRGHIRLP